MSAPGLLQHEGSAARGTPFAPLPALLLALARHEWRLRARRTSCLVILGLVIVGTWMMIPDNSGTMTLMAVREQRMAYDSSTLAVGGGLLANLLFGLMGFFLARGRSQQELHCGVAPLLASSPLHSGWLLLGRWLGSMAFLMSLAALALLTLVVLQLLRGEGPVQAGPYLAIWLLGMGPSLLLCASMALLCDAWAPLMRRRGDLLFFACWVGQFLTLPFTLGDGPHRLQPLLALDFTGLSAIVTQLEQMLGTTHLNIGGTDFDPSLGVGHLPEGLWSWPLVSLRLLSALLALLPLLPAFWLFHRYDPDHVKAASVKAGSRWRKLIDTSLQPLARGAGRLLPLCARVPGWPGQVLADACLALVGQPLTVLALPVLLLLGMSVPVTDLGSMVLATTAVWGLMICGMGAQDHQAGILSLSASAPGGPGRRRLRPFASALLLGLLFCAPALLRWALITPTLALGLLGGLLMLSGLSAALGHWTRGSRTFLALFLFWLYVATQARDIPWLDLMAFNGQAQLMTAATSAGLGLAALGLLMLQRART
ncbi:hypothetical protein ACS5PK_11625 [Roseateles sp. DB2]|uniref:hypothetical protein n=1 Tax=Roseateles sp. DB2 TaxID=3453717 RepID=UPI003EEC5B26